MSHDVVCVCVLSCFSCVRLFAVLWTVACQAPLSMGFSGQEYWSGLPFPSLWDLPNPGIEPASPMSLALAGEFFTWEAPRCGNYSFIAAIIIIPIIRSSLKLEQMY